MICSRPLFPRSLWLHLCCLIMFMSSTCEFWFLSRTFLPSASSLCLCSRSSQRICFYSFPICFWPCPVPGCDIVCVWFCLCSLVSSVCPWIMDYGFVCLLYWIPVYKLLLSLTLDLPLLFSSHHQLEPLRRFWIPHQMMSSPFFSGTFIIENSQQQKRQCSLFGTGHLLTIFLVVQLVV